MSTAEVAWYELQPEGNSKRLVVSGAWTKEEARRLDPLIRSLDVRGYKEVEVDCAALSRLDTVGAWLLLRTGRILRHRGVTLNPVNVAPEYRALVHTINHECLAPPVAMPAHHTLSAPLERIGRG